MMVLFLAFLALFIIVMPVAKWIDKHTSSNTLFYSLALPIIYPLFGFHKWILPSVEDLVITVPFLVPLKTIFMYSILYFLYSTITYLSFIAIRVSVKYYVENIHDEIAYRLEMIF